MLSPPLSGLFTGHDVNFTSSAGQDEALLSHNGIPAFSRLKKSRPKSALFEVLQIILLVRCRWQPGRQLLCSSDIVMERRIKILVKKPRLKDIPNKKSYQAGNGLIRRGFLGDISETSQCCLPLYADDTGRIQSETAFGQYSGKGPRSL